jgi:hypothetical protein
VCLFAANKKNGESPRKKNVTLSFSVTFFLPFGLRPVFILLQINTHTLKFFRDIKQFGFYP